MNSSDRKRTMVVLGTGGTIAGRASSAADNLAYTAGQVSVEDLVGRLDLPVEQTRRVVAEQVAQVDSKDMRFGVWQQLARRCAHWLARPDVEGVVITHGTDTLEETALFLDRVLSPAKPVVLTCAMRPATALVPDGPGNLRDALCVAGAPGARGVVAVCAGSVHSAEDVRKIHTYRLDAFDSGDAGPIAYVEEGALRPLRGWPGSVDRGGLFARVDACPVAPRVEVVQSHADADGLLVDLLVDHRRSSPADGVAGIVLAATGNGSLHEGLVAAARRAQAEGIEMLCATRVARGRIIPVADAPFETAGALTPAKARVELMLRLLGRAGGSPST